jgi:hypothetical protein
VLRCRVRSCLIILTAWLSEETAKITPSIKGAPQQLSKEIFKEMHFFIENMRAKEYN